MELMWRNQFVLNKYVNAFCLFQFISYNYLSCEKLCNSTHLTTQLIYDWQIQMTADNTPAGPLFSVSWSSQRPIKISRNRDSLWFLTIVLQRFSWMWILIGRFFSFFQKICTIFLYSDFIGFWLISLCGFLEFTGFFGKYMRLYLVLNILKFF